VPANSLADLSAVGAHVGDGIDAHNKFLARS
jgi:hypothetical protein